VPEVADAAQQRSYACHQHHGTWILSRRPTVICRDYLCNGSLDEAKADSTTRANTHRAHCNVPSNKRARDVAVSHPRGIKAQKNLFG
jgi:hypothetical protein